MWAVTQYLIDSIILKPSDYATPFFLVQRVAYFYTSCLYYDPFYLMWAVTQYLIVW